MRIVLLTLLAFLGGTVAGYLVAVFAGLVYVDRAGVFDRDGGVSMGIIFMIGPLAGIVVGLVAAVTTAARLRRHRPARGN